MLTPNPTRHRSPARTSGALLLLLACNGRRCGGPDDTGQDCAEADRHLYYADSDGDGYGDALEVTEACVAPAGTVTNGDDCDDTDAARVDMVSRWARPTATAPEQPTSSTLPSMKTRGPATRT